MPTSPRQRQAEGNSRSASKFVSLHKGSNRLSNSRCESFATYHSPGVVLECRMSGEHIGISIAGRGGSSSSRGKQAKKAGCDEFQDEAKSVQSEQHPANHHTCATG